MKLSLAYLFMQMPAPSEVFLAVEVRALIRAGIDVNVFCLRKPHPEHEKLLSDQQLSNVSIEYFPYLFSWRIWGDVAYWLRLRPTTLWHMISLITRTCWRRPSLWIKSLSIIPKSFAIARCVQRELIGIVHAAWGHYPSITAYLIKRLMPSVQYTLALGAYDRVVQHPMTAIAARHAACILTQSEASASLLKNCWPKSSTSISVIARGIEIEALSSFRDVTEKPAGLIVSVGRLIEDKGHHYVARAFAEVHRSMPHTRLVILGEGVYRPGLEHLVAKLGISDAVELPGHLSQPQLFRRLSQSSVFVLASESETDNLPNTIKEAMCVGIPVITTPTTGIEELVQHEVTGLIVPMADVEALADSILRILSDKAFANNLVRRAIRIVEESFDIKKTTRERKQLYYQLAGHHGSSCSLVCCHANALA